MKQGEQGHIYASKAEEWAVWCMSATDNCSFTTPGYIKHMKLWRDYLDEWRGSMDTEASHSHAQRQIAPEIGVTTNQPHLNAVGRLNLVLIATSIGMAIALWKGWL